MAIDKITSAGITTDAVGPTQLNEAANYAFTGTVTGAGESNIPYFHAALENDQTVSDNTMTKVQCNLEAFDSANAYDNSTNYRFTPQTAGKYFVYGQVRANGSSNIYKIQLNLKVNGNNITAGTYGYIGQSSFDVRGNTASDPSVTSCGIITLNGSSDYLELFAQVDVSSGTPYVFGSKSSYFGAYFLSST
tara:strand:+ start:40 stop:612 length:573 start_codon:yes stop_codon:yes gene_type:complete